MIVLNFVVNAGLDRDQGSQRPFQHDYRTKVYFFEIANENQKMLTNSFKGVEKSHQL